MLIYTYIYIILEYEHITPLLGFTSVLMLIFSQSGRSIGQAFAYMVDFLRCSSQGGREETIPTSCSIGSWNIAHTWRPLEGPDVAQVWGSEARPRGNAEEDCQLHWLCPNGKPDSGASGSKMNTLHLPVPETERAHEIWQLPEDKFTKQKRSKLVKNPGR